MAGAGYKLFNTGDVLTAAQVNTYLMEQTVMVFADAAARTTALTGVVSEGMLSYLKDTNAVEVYNGSAWVSSDDPNAIQNTIVDAKGDLITATAADTPARLAVGNNGETLVADSAASTGLRWQGNYSAGKNKIINGDFGIWQRGTSFTGQANGDFSADRWRIGFNGAGATATTSRQTFTPGTAPVAGYEGTYFLRHDVSVAGSGSTARVLRQYIEDVRTFAGQTVTLSFWAKADSARTITSGLAQVFGTGGSTAVATATQANSVTTSWTRFTQVISVPSVSGQTIGTDSYLRVDLAMPVNTTMTIDIWGVQVEAGNVATAFQTATGTLQGELAACQRYYYLHVSGNNFTVAPAFNYSATIAYANIAFPVTMRTEPTLVASSGTDYYTFVRNGGTDNFNSLTIERAAKSGTAVYNSSEISGTAGQAGYAFTNNASSSIAFSAEL